MKNGWKKPNRQTVNDQESVARNTRKEIKN